MGRSYRCLDGQICKRGACVILSGTNQKDMSRYSSKEAFLISDANWKEVLPWVSAVIWNEVKTARRDMRLLRYLCVSFLIYHDESNTSNFYIDLYNYESSNTNRIDAYLHRQELLV